MTYNYITAYTSPNQNPARPCSPTSITIHWWNIPALAGTFEGTVKYLCRPDGNSSAHYVVEAGRVACIVDPDARAWHAGDAIGNDTSIGIECHPRMSPADLETVAELICDLRKFYGDLPLYPHSHWTQTQCPGTYRDKLGWLDGRARQLAAQPSRRVPAAKKQSAAPQQKGTSKMLMIYLQDYASGNWVRDSGNLYAIFGPGFFLRFTGETAARAFEKQIGAPALKVSGDFWDHCAAAAQHGSNHDGYSGDLHAITNKLLGE